MVCRLLTSNAKRPSKSAARAVPGFSIPGGTKLVVTSATALMIGMDSTTVRAETAVGRMPGELTIVSMRFFTHYDVRAQRNAQSLSDPYRYLRAHLRE